ncbi:MAG: hypothetical protein U0570_12020 [Phycisphaerales bacterium]
MSKGTTKLGFINLNQQINLGCLNIPGTDHGQTLYHMKCIKCLHEYAANGSDIHLRKCPKCQGGQPSSGGWAAPA